MDLGIMSLNSFGDYNVPPTSSSRSVFNLEPSDFWRGSKSGPVNPFRLEPESKLQRSAPSILADDAAADSFSISFTSPVSGPLSNAASYTDSHKQGYGSGGGSTGGMHGLFTRCREPFTPSQWLDLELQALIYKYIVANVPVPSHLLYQIRKSINPFLYVGSSTSYAPYSFGWAPFRLGLSGSNDPEPGRCRRTDGKKWRCAKEAVPDQKYCERHINRGRHRSRKPVESRKGLVLAGTNNAMEASVASSMSEASVMSSNGTSKSLSLLQQQCKSLQSNAANPSANVVLERVQGQTIKSPTVDIKSEDTRLSFLPQHVGTEGPPMQEFGLVSSTSLLYTSDKSSYTDSRNRDVFLSFNKQDAQNKQPLHRFMDDWPKNQSERLTVGWSEEFKSDWTQLSMSFPKNSSTFSSCSNSPREKFTVTPSELDPTNMNLALQYDRSEKQKSWIPVTWENSLGGPLGEALHSTSTSVEASRSSLMLNLTNREFWDSHSKLESSPTGVLQKTTLVSVSSSAGSSPRGGNHVGGSSVPDDVPCSALVSIPSL